jgi:demethylmenaquinone methyltransferase/2-methoxy-6-polyprenyl-1,4-benzoquinol methylase
MAHPPHRTPDPDRALRDYRALAPGYDAACALLGPVRQAAIAALALRPGEYVVDVACGTGAALPLLAEAVGPQGRVVGIEQSPEMLALARRRLDASGLSTRVTLVETAAQRATLPGRADALLFCYTHDVLQTPAALRAIFAAARPGARVAVAGMRFLPWWGGPVNLWLRLRARRYVTTFDGMRRPWAPLETYCPDVRVERGFHLGTSYLATATYRGERITTAARSEERGGAVGRLAPAELR